MAGKLTIRPRGFCGELRRGPGLAGILRGRGHAAQRGSPAARNARAMPTARCARQDLIAARGSALPGMPDIQTNGIRSPRCCLARASREESTHQPLPLTPASTRNTSLPPTQAPPTAGDRGGDVTVNGQDAQIAASGATKTSAALAGCGAQIIRFWLVPEVFSGRPCRAGRIFGGGPAC